MDELKGEMVELEGTSRARGTIYLSDSTTCSDIFEILLIPIPEFPEGAQRRGQYHSKVHNYHAMRDFEADYPNLLEMVTQFEENARDATKVFGKYVDLLDHDEVGILGKFLYMWWLKNITHNKTYNIGGFRKLVEEMYDQQVKIDTKNATEEREEKAAKKAAENTRRQGRIDKLCDNVAQILTKVDELDTKINSIISKLPRDPDTDVGGGSKKKRKYRTKKR